MTLCSETQVTLKLGRRASGHFVTLIEIHEHLIRAISGHIFGHASKETQGNIFTSPLLSVSVSPSNTDISIVFIPLTKRKSSTYHLKFSSYKKALKIEAPLS